MMHKSAKSSCMKFSQCWLHIGTEKTGTTSIQAAFSRNRQLLLKKGILYPESIGRDGNHSALVTFSANDNRQDDLRRLAKVFNEEDVKLHRQYVKECFEDECRAVENASTLVLSSEHLHSRLTTSEEIARLRNLLAPWCDRINVIVYLRPQHELALSRYSTVVKSGGTTRDCLPQVDWRTHYFNYNRLLSLWAKVFGKENLRPRIYSNRELVGNDIFHDFAFSTGLDVDEIAPTERSNPSLSPEGLELLRLLNPYMPRFIGNEINNSRAELIRALENQYPGKGIVPSRASVEKFYQRFEHSNKNACKNFFPERDELFEVDFSAYPESGREVNLSLDEAAAMFSRLWNVCAENIRQRDDLLGRPLSATINQRAGFIKKSFALISRFLDSTHKCIT